MTDIERKAWELANSVGTYKKALCRVIEQHEAFKQEVSDAVEAVLDRYYVLNIEDMLSHLIIAKPDPLAEMLEKDFGGYMPDADDFRAALEARGLEIREKGQ